VFVFKYIIFTYTIHKMGFKFGSILGRALGDIGSQLIPIKGLDGGSIGSALGGLSGFKDGGKIPGKRGKARLVICHGGETVIPLGCPVSKSQKAFIAKKKRASKNK
jgi:hypothetical protein